MQPARKLAEAMTETQTLAELTSNFALPGVLAFDSDAAHGDLPRAQVTLPTGSATVYLHGAHLTHWQAAGQPPVLWLSPLSEFKDGKAIRGGIPVCFPWFANDTGNHDHTDPAQPKPGPAHGFARTQPWQLAFAALAGQALHLTFTLGPNDLSRKYGYDHFRVAYEMIFGLSDTLTLRLSVANTGTQPLHFEEALHTYFNIGDIHATTLTGLESAPFLDKTEGNRQETGPATALDFPQWTDRVYPGNMAAAIIHDQHHHRTIAVAKHNSATTIVWNPYPEGSAGVRDLAPDSWHSFLAVETANAGPDALTLQPNEAHTMQALITTSPV